jgi:hypothetical protein
MNAIRLVDADIGADTRSWTSRFIQNIDPFITDFPTRPINYMEIGVFAGVTAQYMLENVLIHPGSRLTGIDVWDIKCYGEGCFPKNEIGKKRYTDMMDNLENIRKKYISKVTWLKGKSTDMLVDSKFKRNSFDLIYIDGDHRCFSVLMDFAHTWPLLKVGGIMVFDDYKRRVKAVADFIIGPVLNEFRLGRNKRGEIIFNAMSQLGIKKLRDL